MMMEPPPARRIAGTAYLTDRITGSRVNCGLSPPVAERHLDGLAHPADNKMALNAGWDPELLRLELGELELDGFDLALTGFSDIELKELRAERTEGLTDPDDNEIAEHWRRQHQATGEKG
jgi:hypothetical protein